MAYNINYDASGKLLVTGIECACPGPHTLPRQDI